MEKDKGFNQMEARLMRSGWQEKNIHPFLKYPPYIRVKDCKLYSKYSTRSRIRKPVLIILVSLQLLSNSTFKYEVEI